MFEADSQSCLLYANKDLKMDGTAIGTAIAAIAPCIKMDGTVISGIFIRKQDGWHRDLDCCDNSTKLSQKPSSIVSELIR